MGKFEFIQTGMEGLYVINPTVIEDSRGYFMETYNVKDFEVAELNMKFVQDNESYSTKGVIRGLHFQNEHTQGKLVRVIKGEIYDVAVDIRKNSKTYGKWYGILLTSYNKKQLYVSEGFAHGFLVLSDTTKFIYKCTDYYHPQSESGILWNDPDIGIKWPLETIGIENIIMSEKDKNLKSLKETKTNF